MPMSQRERARAGARTHRRGSSCTMIRGTTPARLVATCLACLALASVARADIVSTTGSISVITAPTGTLHSGTLESDTSLYTWFESKVVSPGTLNLEHTGSGTVTSTSSANAQTVTPNFANSYVVHLDQVGSGSVTLSGSITFDHAIIGVWYTTSGLQSSNSTFAPSGLTYGTASRGLELGTGSGSDSFSISSDGLTLTIIQFRVGGSGVDELRILVSPEPGTGALLGLGLLSLVGVVVRRRRARRAPRAA